MIIKSSKNTDFKVQKAKLVPDGLKNSNMRTTKNPFLFLILFVVSLLATPALGQVNVPTAQNDNARSGANLNETILNTSNVNVSQFGRLFSRSLDGYLYAQPLYVPNVAIPGQGTHNVVYVATMHNTVLAFDADNPNQAAPFWQVNLGPSRPCCPQPFLTPEIGILGTPVIDPASSTLYVVAATLELGSYVYRLHALDITNGQEKFGGPVKVQASVPGSGYDNQGGVVVFNSQKELQRPGLLLASGTVYVAFGSIDDGDPWHGWLIGYNASNIQQQVCVYNATPNGGRGAIWQSGRGPVSDANGYVYSMTGNGDYDGISNFGDSIVKLSAAGVVNDWFTPDNQDSLAASDSDLGSGGPLLIPNTNLLVGGGKQGILYVVNSSNMGHLQIGNGQIVQSFQASTRGEIHHTAYWNRSGAPLLFLWASNDVLTAFQFGNGIFNSTPVARSALNSNFPGGVMSVSANGSTAGSGIVWATTAGGDSSSGVVVGTLRAFDASNVSNELWNSDQNSARDKLGNFAKFASPTIVNGKVYVPTFSNQLVVYGLVGSSSNGVGISLGPASVTLANAGQQQFTATVTGTSNAAVNWSMSPSIGTLTANGLYTAPGAISGSQTITITATSVADSTKSATATVTLSPVATTGTATFVARDTTTQGNWKTVYGADGYNVINDTVAYPKYVTVTPSGANAATWARSTTDVRALSKASSATDRIAATWFNNSSFLIDMAFNDGLQHRVAIYCLDWDTTLRAETINILDANGVLLDTENVSNFHNGQYLVWQLSGHVQLRMTNTAASANGVISGLFFDSVATPVTVSVSPPSVTLANSGQQQFTATVTGTSNTAVNWSMSPSIGTLTANGLYTAPGTISSSQTITITVTSVADSTKSATATVTLSPAVVSVSPPSVTLANSGQQQFTATVTGTSNTAVNWSMSPSIGTLTANGLYTAPGTISSSQTITITATSVADSTKSATATVTLSPLATTGTATFAAWDTTTQGNWKTVYGADGYNVINDTVTYPTYVTVTPSGANGSSWARSTTDVRALSKASSATDRIAANWFNNSSFLIDMAFNDGLQHRMAIYCLDWDTTMRAETIDILDANGVLLNTENVNNFHNGQYLVWQLSGHVQIRVTNGVASANGVISGLFFDSVAAPVTVSVSPPSVTLANSGQQQFTATVTGTSNTAVNWSMSPSIGTLTANGLYTAPGTISSSQTITIIATSVADSTKSATATVNLSPVGTTGTATFAAWDTTTQGNWKTVYGADGYNVINDTVAYPKYVTVTPSGANPYTWASSTTDVRALSKASSATDRIAATWFNNSSISIDMAFNDGLQHRVAIYCLDWDTTLRAETIDILDANGILLDTEKLNNFHNGQYLVWQLSGHVRIRVTSTARGANGVISGLFFR